MENCWGDVPHGSQDCYPHYNLFQSSIFYDTDNFRVKYEDCLPSESSENEERSAEPPDKPPEAPAAKEKRVIKKYELYVNPDEFVSKNQEYSNTGIEPPSLPASQPWGYDWTKQSWVKELAPMVVIRDASRLLFPNLVDPQDKPNFSNSKGESMMQKMGWQGGALGKTGNGILRSISPDPVYAFRPSAGFGQRTRTAPRLSASEPSPPLSSPPTHTPSPSKPTYTPTVKTIPTKAEAFSPPIHTSAPKPTPYTPTVHHPSKAEVKAIYPFVQTSAVPTPTPKEAMKTPTPSPKTPKNEGKAKEGKPSKAKGGKVGGEEGKAVEGFKAVKKCGPKRDVFRTNVLLQILDFVQDDTETELLFDSSLRQYERRHIANIVNTVVNDQAIHTLGSVAQYDIARDIHKCNAYVLDTCPHGENRQLAIYKEAPEDVYLVTPEDFLPKDDVSDADGMDMDDDENPFLKSIKKSIKKDEPVEARDEVNNKDEPKSISNKFETGCSIAKPKNGKAETPVPAADKMLEFFLEFAEAEAYKEMKFLGAFTDEQITAINNLLNDIALCCLDWRSFAGDRDLARVFRHGGSFTLREGANGTTEVHKVPTARRNTE